MTTTCIQRRAAWFVSAIMLLLPVSTALAQGNGNSNMPIDISFTKWRTAVVPPSGVPSRFLFKGIVGGELGDGDFVGEVLDRKVSTPCSALDPPCTPGVTPPTITGSIISLQAIYEVQVGEHSFTALIQGGTNGVTGAALLDGVILAGWRTGAPVHVEFQTIPAATGCEHAPLNTTCFEGTIHVGRVPTRQN